MLHRYNFLRMSSLMFIASTLSFAAVPNSPGPYVGVNNVTDTSARISFLDNSTDEDGFKVYIHDENDVFDATVSPNPVMVPKNDTASLYQYATITGLSADTLYLLHVTAYNEDGESEKTIPSSENNGRIKTSPLVCKPAMPGEYVGTYNITNTSARISFKDNSDDEDGFNVYLYDGTTKALLDTIVLPPLSGVGGYQYTDITGLTEDTLYEVSVTAFSAGCDESDPTKPSSSTNGRFKTTNESCPSMPGDYVGTYQVSSTSARIAFIDNSDNETGFKVYVYDAASSLVKTLTLPASTGVGTYQYATITGLDPNSFYEVKVSAFNDSCESDTTTPSSSTNGRFTTTAVGAP